MMYQSKNGKYRVDLGLGEAVQLQPENWLSKFSAAIYNNHWTAKRPPATNIGFQPDETIIETAAAPISEREQRKFILAHLKAKHKPARASNQRVRGDRGNACPVITEGAR
jgi:catalase (peroxidase I)